MIVEPVTIIISSGNEREKNSKYKIHFCGSFVAHSKCFVTVCLL